MSANGDHNSTRFLDGLRGLAALYVVIHHARSLLWETYTHGYLAHPQEYSLLDKACMWSLTAFQPGRLAVLFFFVLSGFVIHLRQSRNLLANPTKVDINVGSFIYRRFRRIYPALLFAIVLTYGLDVAGFQLGFPTFTGNPTKIQVSLRHGWDVLLGNLFMVNGTYVANWGTNAALWSLKYEWWFYMAYPAVLILSRGSVKGGLTLVASLCALSFWDVAMPFDLARDIFQMLLLWWLGVLMAEVYVGRLGIPLGCLMPLVVLVPCAVVLERLNAVPQVVTDYCGALGMIGIIACGFHPRWGKWLRKAGKLKWLGDCSYTLYVIHYPMMIFMSGWLMSRHPDNMLPMHFGYVVVGSIVSVVVAYGCYQFTEKPFLARRRTAKVVSVTDGSVDTTIAD